MSPNSHGQRSCGIFFFENSSQEEEEGDKSRGDSANHLEETIKNERVAKKSLKYTEVGKCHISLLFTL